MERSIQIGPSYSFYLPKWWRECYKNLNEIDQKAQKSTLIKRSKEADTIKGADNHAILHVYVVSM